MSCLKAFQKLLICCCRKQEAGIDKPDISRLSYSIFLKSIILLNKNILGTWYYNKACEARTREERMASVHWFSFLFSLFKCIVSQAKVGKLKSYGIGHSYSIHPWKHSSVSISKKPRCGIYR